MLFALLTLLLAAPAPRTPVILDTDIGTDIDDAWALAFVLAHEPFDLLGVTISDGDTPARAKVAAKVLNLVGRSDVPVAVGRRTPPPEGVDYQFQWAEDFTAKVPITTSAADFLVEEVRKRPGEITLIAVGPLQNVADALRKEPRLPKLVKRLVLMSGCVYGSVWGLVAEWNVIRARADAELVYSAGFPLTIVPLDATTRVVLQQTERERLRKRITPLTTALEALYRLWLAKPDQRMTLHDQLAVAEAAWPGRFFARMETVPLAVDEKGFTRVDPARGRPVAVALEPRRDAFMEAYLGALLDQSLGLAKIQAGFLRPPRMRWQIVSAFFTSERP